MQLDFVSVFDGIDNIKQFDFINFFTKDFLHSEYYNLSEKTKNIVGAALFFITYNKNCGHLYKTAKYNWLIENICFDFEYTSLIEPCYWLFAFSLGYCHIEEVEGTNPFQKIKKDIFDNNFITQIQKYAVQNPRIFLGKEEDFITIYRGECTRSSAINNALSWTLNKKIAKWFATRYSDGIVYTAKVQIRDIVSYIPFRGEEEVLVIPNTAKIIKIQKYTQSKVHSQISHYTLKNNSLFDEVLNKNKKFSNWF